ncbi:unnamed protein product, partial [Ceratitis capitata]
FKILELKLLDLNYLLYDICCMSMKTVDFFFTPQIQARSGNEMPSLCIRVLRTWD